MSIDAMKQALEYLDSPSSKLWPAGTQYNIITALRLAIEQAEKQESYWQEEARRYAGNADFWREKAKRQPLTDKEIDKLAVSMVKGDKSANWLARAIERAHGIGGGE
jgi:hypothetical protein